MDRRMAKGMSRRMIVSLAVIASSAFPQETVQSQREAMYHRYLDFASQTMKVVEALIRGGTPYDLVVLPEAHHSLSGTDERYELEAARRYFQEHLKP